MIFMTFVTCMIFCDFYDVYDFRDLHDFYDFLWSLWFLWFFMAGHIQIVFKKRVFEGLFHASFFFLLGVLNHFLVGWLVGFTPQHPPRAPPCLSSGGWGVPPPPSPNPTYALLISNPTSLSGNLSRDSLDNIRDPWQLPMLIGWLAQGTLTISQWDNRFSDITLTLSGRPRELFMAYDKMWDTWPHIWPGHKNLEADQHECEQTWTNS